MTRHNTRLTALAAGILAALALLAGMLAAPMESHAWSWWWEDDDKADYSLYSASSAAHSFFEKAVNPAEDTNWDQYKGGQKQLTMTDASVFTGYSDPDKTDILNTLSSIFTSGAQKTSYDTYRNVGQGFEQYATYGKALSELGLDSTVSVGLVPNMVRGAAGVLLLIVYTIAAFTELLFKLALNILIALNPFKWLYAGVLAASATFAKWMGVDGAVGVARISDMFSGLYASFVALGWAVCTLLFVCALAGAVMAWGASGAQRLKSGLKKYVVRVVFIMVGVPLLGGMYTGVLASMSKDLDVQTSNASAMVAGVLVDFEAWVKAADLALPSGAVIQVDRIGSGGFGEGVEGEVVRSYVYGVNRDVSSTARDLAVKVNALSGAYGGVAAQYATGDVTDVGGFGESADPSTQWRQILAAYGVIGRYISGASFDASSYESYAKGNMPQGDGSKKVFAVIKDKLVKQDEWAKTNLLAHGDAKALTGNGCAKDFDAVSSGHVVFKGGLDSPQGAVAGGGTTASGLPTLGMYNYLSSEFGDTDVTVYSTSSNTINTKTAHSSVNNVGGGLLGVLYMITLLVKLAALGLIAVMFSMSMMVNTIARSFKFIVHIPFAMMGSFKAMSTVIMHVAMMVLEIIGTILVYEMVCAILFDMSGLITQGFQFTTTSDTTATWLPHTMVTLADFDRDGGGGANPVQITDNGSYLVQCISEFASIIVIVFFTLKALTLRGHIIKALDDQAAQLLDRVFGSLDPAAAGQGAQMAGQPTMTDRIGQGAKALGGAALGVAGMALAGPAGAAAAGAISQGLGMTDGPRVEGGEAGAQNALEGAGQTMPGLPGRADASQAALFARQRPRALGAGDSPPVNPAALAAGAGQAGDRPADTDTVMALPAAGQGAPALAQGMAGDMATCTGQGRPGQAAGEQERESEGHRAQERASGGHRVGGHRPLAPAQAQAQADAAALATTGLSPAQLAGGQTAQGQTAMPPVVNVTAQPAVSVTATQSQPQAAGQGGQTAVPAPAPAPAPPAGPVPVIITGTGSSPAPAPPAVTVNAPTAPAAATPAMQGAAGPAPVINVAPAGPGSITVTAAPPAPAPSPLAASGRTVIDTTIVPERKHANGRH